MIDNMNLSIVDIQKDFQTVYNNLIHDEEKWHS